MLTFLAQRLRRLFCRHVWRDSRSWPGVRVCVRCGARGGRGFQPR